MAVVRRVDPVSLFKLVLVLYFLVGILMAVVFYLASLVVGTSPFLAPTHVVLLAIPIAYGIFGAVGALIVAALYNLVAGWVGGVKVELD